MNANYMLACGVVWNRTGDPEAGWELVEALHSKDPKTREIAQGILLEGGDTSFDFMEDAIRAGAAAPEALGACMAEILRRRQSRESGERQTTRCCDAWLS